MDSVDTVDPVDTVNTVDTVDTVGHRRIPTFQRGSSKYHKSGFTQFRALNFNESIVLETKGHYVTIVMEMKTKLLCQLCPC